MLPHSPAPAGQAARRVPRPAVRAAAPVGWLLVALLLPSAGRASDDPALVEPVRRLNAAMLDVAQHAEPLGYKGRFERLAPVVPAVFDVDFMAEKSIGRHWKTLSDADRTRWRDLFRDFMTANYAGNLDRNTGQRFELLGHEQAANATAIVRSKVIDPAGEDVELGYRVQQSGATWKIIDVYLKGTVSELALRRSDYTAVLERSGFEALATLIRTRIDDLAAGRAKQPRP